MDWDGDCASIGVLHHVVAARDSLDNESCAFKRLDHLRPRYDRDATGHKPGSYQKSGDIECQSQLVWWPDCIEQSFKGSTEVGDRLFRRWAITDRADAGTEEGRGAPDTVLVLLEEVGNMNGPGHTFSIA